MQLVKASIYVLISQFCSWNKQRSCSFTGLLRKYIFVKMLIFVLFSLKLREKQTHNVMETTIWYDCTYDLILNSAYNFLKHKGCDQEHKKEAHHRTLYNRLTCMDKISVLLSYVLKYHKDLLVYV